MSPITIVEIKARCTQAQRVRDYLRSHGADVRGTDHQTDTYFRVPHGRLKLREGRIENVLIDCEHTDQASAKSFQAGLGIQPRDLVAGSYSDLLLAQAKRA